MAAISKATVAVAEPLSKARLLELHPWPAEFAKAKKIERLWIYDLPGTPQNIVPVARLKHDGDWDPEPWAWVRESRLFRRQTSIGLEPTSELMPA